MRKALDMPDRILIQDRKLVPHALAGHLLLEEWLTDTWGWPRAAARQVAVAVGGHHGVPPEREELPRPRPRVLPGVGARARSLATRAPELLE